MVFWDRGRHAALARAMPAQPKGRTNDCRLTPQLEQVNTPRGLPWRSAWNPPVQTAVCRHGLSQVHAQEARI